MYWPPLVIDGIAIDLAHLEPLVMPCPTPGQPATCRINVRYSNHCFTEAFDPDRHDPARLVVDHKRPRAFDPSRYELSKRLPAMIGALPGARVHQTPERRNYLYFTALSELPGTEYQMFFTVKKARADASHHVELFVESAYSAAIGSGARVKRPNAIRFSVLALKTCRGEPIRFAPR